MGGRKIWHCKPFLISIISFSWTAAHPKAYISEPFGSVCGCDSKQRLPAWNRGAKSCFRIPLCQRGLVGLFPDQWNFEHLRLHHLGFNSNPKFGAGSQKFRHKTAAAEIWIRTEDRIPKQIHLFPDSLRRFYARLSVRFFHFFTQILRRFVRYAD